MQVSGVGSSVSSAVELEYIFEIHFPFKLPSGTQVISDSTRHARNKCCASNYRYSSCKAMYMINMYYRGRNGRKRTGLGAGHFGRGHVLSQHCN